MKSEKAHEPKKETSEAATTNVSRKNNVKDIWITFGSDQPLPEQIQPKT